MPFSRRALLLLSPGLILQGCASGPPILHTVGQLQLQLLVDGVEAPRTKLVGAVRDDRPVELRGRKVLVDGEIYGDEDFATPPPVALIQEIDRALVGQKDELKLRARLAQSMFVLQRFEVSLRLPQDDKKASLGSPPIVDAAGGLIVSLLGGVKSFTCALTVEIDGKRYSESSGELVTGAPPVPKDAVLPYFRKAVSKLVASLAKQP